jgi:hypothetical protein
LGQAGFDGRVGGGSLADEVSRYQPRSPFGSLAWESPIKKDLQPGSPQAAVFLQELDELFFIVQALKPPAEFGDQVMPINQVFHNQRILLLLA